MKSPPWNGPYSAALVAFESLPAVDSLAGASIVVLRSYVEVRGTAAADEWVDRNHRAAGILTSAVGVPAPTLDNVTVIVSLCTFRHAVEDTTTVMGSVQFGTGSSVLFHASDLGGQMLQVQTMPTAEVAVVHCRNVLHVGVSVDSYPAYASIVVANITFSGNFAENASCFFGPAERTTIRLSRTASPWPSLLGAATFGSTT